MKQYTGKLSAFICGLILLVVSIICQDVSNIKGVKDWICILSNAALVPGVLLTGFGLLVRIAGEGIFDGIKYALSSMLTHLRREQKRHATYYDYTQRKKKQENASSLLLSGIFYLAAAVIMTILFYL